jgi:hypothetical protein
MYICIVLGWNFDQFFRMKIDPKSLRPKWSFVKKIPGRPSSAARTASSPSPSALASADRTFWFEVYLHNPDRWMVSHPIRVARWFVFKPKILILVKFGGPWNGKCCYIV